MKILVVDVGGSHVKIMATGQADQRRMPSGTGMTAAQMAAGVRKLAEGWKYDHVSIGYPGVVVRNRPTSEPHNLGKGWVGFDYEGAFKCPVRIINDADHAHEPEHRRPRVALEHEQVVHQLR